MTQSLSHLTPARERLLLFALAGVQLLDEEGEMLPLRTP